MAVLKKRPVVSEKETINDSELESESESGSDLGADEDVKLTEPSKNAVYNKEGLLDKLGDISWPEKVDWIHKLTVDIDREQEVDVNDDLARELAFYTQALEGTRQAFLKFQPLGLPFLRPTDYYAEMVKTDNHMEKIKGRLLAEKRRIEEAEERRKARDNKKMAKEVQAQKLKERAKSKKEDVESVKKWMKQRKQSGFAGGEKDADVGFLGFEDGNGSERSSKRRQMVGPGDRSGGKARQGGAKGKKGGGDKKRKSREYKDSKFGFGGRKGMNKQNTAETTNDIRGFNKSEFSKNKKTKR